MVPVAEGRPSYQEVATIYIATFGRAPEFDGLNYWVHDSGLDIDAIAKSFFEQKETNARYPEGFDDSEFIEATYNNLFKRAPDQAGREYWLNALRSGAIDRSQFILAVIRGALKDDLEILQDRTAVGIKFAQTGSEDMEEAVRVIEEAE